MVVSSVTVQKRTHEIGFKDTEANFSSKYLDKDTEAQTFDKTKVTRLFSQYKDQHTHQSSHKPFKHNTVRYHDD
jgi:hypothetical protein